MYIFQPDRYLLRQQVKKFSTYIRGRVLDVGAGHFDRYREFFNYEEYITMDIFEGPNVDVIGSADNIPFEDSSFDSLVSTQVFEHLSNPIKAAREAFRVLKPGGIILITVPQMNELHEEPYDYWRYTKFGLRELFEGQGFKLIEIEQRGGFFAMTAQIFIRYLIDKFNLHHRYFLGKVSSKIFSGFGRAMFYFDSLDTSIANRKNTIGWCAVFRKS